MNFEAHMRVGTVEMTAVLFAVAAFAVRPRVRVAADVGKLVPMRVELTVRELGAERTFTGRPPFDVGRARDADLVLRDPEISRTHLRFDSRGGVVYVNDLGSRNGTFLNGRRLREGIEVRCGDQVDVGTTRLIVTEIAPWT